MKTNTTNISDLANWINFQLSTIIEGVSSGYTLGNYCSVWIDKGATTFTVSLATGEEIKIDSDNYANAEDIAKAIISTLNTNTTDTTNETKAIEKATRPVDVMDAAAFDAGFILKSRNSVTCRWYWLHDINGGDAHNGKGETLVIQVTECKNPGGAHSIPRQWHKLGYTATELQTWWSVDTYVTDANGNCWGKYNPQHIPGKHQLNFKCVKEATPANLRELLKEVARQFLND